MIRRRRKFTYSRTSPTDKKRGCLCADGKTYSSRCCDGTLQAQGIGSVNKSQGYLLTETRNLLRQEDNTKIIL